MVTLNYVQEATLEAAKQLRPWHPEEGKERQRQIFQAGDLRFFHGMCRAQKGRWGEGDKPVVAGDWNGLVMNKAAALFEEAGAELLWSDMVLMCDNCLGAIDTHPNGWSHRPEYVIFGHDEVLCTACLLDEDDFVAEFLEEKTYYPGDTFDTPVRAIQYHIGPDVLERLGWRRYRDHLETGWHPGQNADPGTIATELWGEHEDAAILFRLDSHGQFDVRWSAWYKDGGG